MTAGLKRWLEIDSSYRRVFQTKRNDRPHFVQINKAINRRDQYDVCPNLRQAIQCTQFLRQDAWLTT